MLSRKISFPLSQSLLTCTYISVSSLSLPLFLCPLPLLILLLLPHQRISLTLSLSLSLLLPLCTFLGAKPHRTAPGATLRAPRALTPWTPGSGGVCAHTSSNQYQVFLLFLHGNCLSHSSLCGPDLTPLCSPPLVSYHHVIIYTPNLRLGLLE